MICRIRIMTPEGRVHVVDQSWSQLCQTIRPLSAEDKKAFWNKKSMPLPEGGSVKLVLEGV